MNAIISFAERKRKVVPENDDPIHIAAVFARINPKSRDLTCVSSQILAHRSRIESAERLVSAENSKFAVSWMKGLIANLGETVVYSSMSRAGIAPTRFKSIAQGTVAMTESDRDKLMKCNDDLISTYCRCG